MENKFIRVRTDRGVYVYINTNHIQAIHPNLDGCHIYVIGVDYPYTVKGSPEEIIKKINQK
jgi:hypothetical protein